jgi:preprotein translocase subunit SecE
LYFEATDINTKMRMLIMAEQKKLEKVAAKDRIIKFFKEVRSELKKVIWPTKQQLFNNTLTVLLACLVVGALIWTTDYGLGRLMKFVFAK